MFKFVLLQVRHRCYDKIIVQYQIFNINNVLKNTRVVSNWDKIPGVFNSTTIHIDIYFVRHWTR